MSIADEKLGDLNNQNKTNKQKINQITIIYLPT